MKRTWKTRLTALMFSAAAIGTGMLTNGCGQTNLYGPPPVSEIETEQLPVSETDSPAAETDFSEPEAVSMPDAEIDLDTMTDEDFRDLTDEQLITLGKQYTRLKAPAFCGELPAGIGDQLSMTGKAAHSQEEAFAVACAEKIPQPESLFSEKKGCWWLYDAGSGMAYWYVVPDSAFFDPETQTLRADVTAENVLQLAAMRRIPGERVLGAFVKDEGNHFTCTEYYLLYSTGDYGLSDTASFYGFTFTADKETGQLTGFDSDQYDFCKTVEIPDTYHPYPDE